MKSVRTYILLLVFIFAATACSVFLGKPDLEHINQKLQNAQNDEERAEILNELDNYYLTLQISDSIIADIERKVRSSLQASRPSIQAPLLTGQETALQRETILQNFIPLLMQSRGSGKDIPDSVFALYRVVASRLDSQTQSSYWTSFIERTREVATEEALDWLRAREAYHLCKKNYFRVERWREAEQWAAYALQRLVSFEDPRLETDIKLRLQVILFYFRGLYDLSYWYGQRLLARTKSIRYPLRSVSIRYYQAEAFLEQGENTKAEDILLQVLNQTRKQEYIPGMRWFQKNSLLNLIYMYWHNGMDKKANEYLQQLTRFNLNNYEKMGLHQRLGLILRLRGEYERAEEEYRQIIRLADESGSVMSKIIALRNLSYLHGLMTNYEKALEYQQEAKRLVEQFDKENQELLCRTNLSLASVYQDMGEDEKADHFARLAEKQIPDLGNQPLRKVELLNILGEFNLKRNNPEKALDNFLRAEKICKSNNLLQNCMEVNLAIASCYLQMGKYDLALQRAKELNRQAIQSGDPEREIDALNLKAQIAGTTGDVARAVSLSGILENKIEKMSVRFKNPDRLIAYRQKIYDYLKNGVLYELHAGRIDSAFARLDRAKARVLKLSQQNILKKNGVGRLSDHPYNLPLKSMAVDYMLTEDSLFVFVVYKSRLKLFRKAVDYRSLQKDVATFLSLISETISIFNEYDPERIKQHYRKTETAGNLVYKKILDWPELNSILDSVDVVYVIPDEYLYKLPFAALPVTEGSKDEYLAKKVAVVQLPGYSYLPRRQQDTNSGRIDSFKVLLSADLSFPGSRSFVSNVKKSFKQVKELDSDSPADKMKLLEQLNGDYDLFIFIGHGRANETRPENASLKFTARNPRKNETFGVELSLADLKKVNWSRPKMVVLLGCETAVGKIYRSTGAAGFQQSFMALGARRVLGSLWKIDAAHSLKQMQNFLSAWKQTGRAESALQQIQIQSLNKLTEDAYYIKPHPYFWGSYVYSQISIN